MPDPASLTASLTITGMDIHEATALLQAIPGGACWEGTTRQPATGGPRYSITITNLNIGAAEALTHALADHTRITQDLGEERL